MKTGTFNYALAFFALLMLTAYAPDGDFEKLFNGTDLSGWVNVIGADDTWTVRNNSIKTSGAPKSVLRTEKQYENYILEFEYRKPSAFGLAGIVIHSDALPAVGQPWPRGINIQFWDSGNAIINAIGGAMIQEVNNPPEKMATPDGEGADTTGEEWNRVQVESRDGYVVLRVNGKTAAMGAYASLRKGFIALKSDGSEIEFRDLRIRELSSSDPPTDFIATEDRGFVSMYDGLNLGKQWELEPGHRGHWTAADWLISYDGKSEERRKSLWSRKEYGDFILIADMKFTRNPEMAESPVVLPDGNHLKNEDGSDKTVLIPYAGDTGIYLRGSSKNQVNMGNRFIGSGEIYGYRADNAMSENVRKALVPKVNADKPPGEWNRYVITMKDDRISVKLNGHLVIDHALLPDIAEKGKIALQDDHASNNLFKFGNLYIRELE